MQSPFSGSFFENYAILELYKNLTALQKRVSFSYYRDSNGKEIDLLIEMNGKIHPIEIKKAAMPKRTEINKFNLLEKDELSIGAGGIVCLIPEVVAIDQMNSFVPVNLI